ncbi:UbiA prenyltransferase family [Crucibulum laeve]|uniref:UbiA prenyltransferase family n=1 Tax=Crucibulum laeve TaxID=68775 RepID=A0A5C3MD81_9AGAR|nr:UbiA prenyltransferase family [Crucibulum laeve]
MQSEIWTVLKASRPPSWTFGPILFGIGIIHSGIIPKSLNVTLLRLGLQIAALSMPLSIVVFGINDVYDYDSDIRNPRKMKDGPEGGILHPDHHRSVRLAAYTSTVFIILSSIITQQSQNIIATLFLTLIGWQYSAPPLRLKEQPIVDSLSNGAIVYLAWFCGFSFSGLKISDAPSKGLMLGLCTSGIHALGAVMDMEADIAGGQKTIAVALGPRLAAVFAASCYLMASATVDIDSIFGAYVYAGLFIMLFPCLRVSWAHRAFQGIVYLSISCAVLWIFVRAWSIFSRKRS